MRLSEIVEAAAVPDGARMVGGAGDPAISAVTHDTRRVGTGTLFCCVPGSRVDGHDMAATAAQDGAVALVVERELPLPMPQVLVVDVRRALGPIAAAFWGHPSHDLDVLGVTGTSGKTTVTHLLRAVFEAAGRPCGVIGTLSGARTTPEATDLQQLLAAERRAGRRAVAVEVSSHGLALHRVDATRFAVAAFTNLSQDHLDFHGTMDEYFAAKARLFAEPFTRRAVICVDDRWGERLAAQVAGRPDVDVVTYSLDDARDLELRPGGAAFRWRGAEVSLRLTGRFNAANAVAAGEVALLCGIDVATIARGLGAAPPVPGRFEPVDAGQAFVVVVDYAHKPDALDNALGAARELLAPGGRLSVVFGCGGDRDAGKRPLMGEVAARLADAVVLTTDNPRSEDPDAIIEQIAGGIGPQRRATVVVEPDRRRAIDRAIAGARPGDVVLIAGKGHEATQAFADRVVPFDDRDVARLSLAEAAQAAGGTDR